MASLFKALADPTRLRIVNLLSVRPLCVCSIEQLLGVSQTAASRHLARLQSAGVLASERRAQWVYYSLDERFVADHAVLLDYLNHQATGEAQLADDRAKMAKHIDEETLCAATPVTDGNGTATRSSTSPARPRKRSSDVTETRTTRNKQEEYV